MKRGGGGAKQRRILNFAWPQPNRLNKNKNKNKKKLSISWCNEYASPPVNHHESCKLFSFFSPYILYGHYYYFIFIFTLVLIWWEWRCSIFHAIHGTPFLGEKFLFGPKRIPWDGLAFYPPRILCYHLLLVEENSVIEERWVGEGNEGVIGKKKRIYAIFFFLVAAGLAQK